jgi:glutaredoxin 2
METEKGALDKQLRDTKEALESTTAELEYLKNALDASQAAQDKLVEDTMQITHQQEEEYSRSNMSQQQLDGNQ